MEILLPFQREEVRGRPVGPGSKPIIVWNAMKHQREGEGRRKDIHAGNECHGSRWHSAGYLMKGIKRRSGRRGEGERGEGRKSLAWNRNKSGRGALPDRPPFNLSLPHTPQTSQWGWVLAAGKGRGKYRYAHRQQGKRERGKEGGPSGRDWCFPPPLLPS